MACLMTITIYAEVPVEPELYRLNHQSDLKLANLFRRHRLSPGRDNAFIPDCPIGYYPSTSKLIRSRPVKKSFLSFGNTVKLIV